MLVGYRPEWERADVQRLLENTLLPKAKLRLPWWEDLAPTQERPRAGVMPSFEAAASDYLHMLQGKYANPNTLNAYESPMMKHVGPFFAYAGDRVPA